MPANGNNMQSSIRLRYLLGFESNILKRSSKTIKLLQSTPKSKFEIVTPRFCKNAFLKIICIE